MQSSKNRILKLLDEAVILSRAQFLKADEAAKIRAGLMNKIDALLEELFRLRRSKEAHERSFVYEAIARIAAMQDKLVLHGQTEEVQRDLEAVRNEYEQRLARGSKSRSQDQAS